MKLEEFQHLCKNVKFIVNKFSENPGRFASIVIQMYWATKDERDAYKSERDTLIADINKLRNERDMYKRKLDDVVKLFTWSINYKLSTVHNTWYSDLCHKLDEVLKNDED